MSQTATHFIMRQSLEGEILGARLIRLILRSLRRASASSALIEAVESQLEDECRHIQLYQEILSELGVQAQAAHPIWKKLFAILGEPDDERSVFRASILLCGIIEPFNLCAVEAIVMPGLSKRHLTIVQEIMSDERRHISLTKLLRSSMPFQVTAEHIAATKEGLQQLRELFSSGLKDELPVAIKLPWLARLRLFFHYRSLLRTLETWPI